MSGFDLLRYKSNYMEGNESFHLAKRVDTNVKYRDIHKAINSSYKINKHFLSFKLLKHFL